MTFCYMYSKKFYFPFLYVYNQSVKGNRCYMQVNPVSNLSVNQKSFGNRDFQRAILEEFAVIDDKGLRQAAVEITDQQLETKKHRRISNALFWSIPMFAGLAAAAVATGGRVPMLKAFAKQAAVWTSAFVGLEAVNAGRNALAKHSEGFEKFQRNNPGLATVLSFGAAIAGFYAGSAVAGKAIAKYGKNIIAKAKNLKIDKFVKESKIINKLSEAVAKVPSSLKQFGKVVLGWTPITLALGSFIHTVDHNAARSDRAVENYEQLKATQAQVRAALAAADEVEA